MVRPAASPSGTLLFSIYPGTSKTCSLGIILQRFSRGTKRLVRFTEVSLNDQESVMQCERTIAGRPQDLGRKSLDLCLSYTCVSVCLYDVRYIILLSSPFLRGKVERLIKRLRGCIVASVTRVYRVPSDRRRKENRIRKLLE